MNTPSTGAPWDTALVEGLLRQVSRSFYLTLRVLPAGVRPQISIAYLIARAADTLADTDAVACGRRLGLLQALRQRLHSSEPAGLDLAPFIQKQGQAAERQLLERLADILALLERFSLEDQQRLRQVLDMITSGQVLDLQRFGEVPDTQVQSLTDDEELDDYIYRVAGCVGEFWTKMCRAHLVGQTTIDDPSLLADGIRFGKGLQLVNILRDLPRDLRRGRCYLPRKRLSTAGLNPPDLLDPGNLDRLRPVFHHYLGVAEAHLAAGWNYTNVLPWACMRLRLACAWPVLIGLRTLGKLNHGNILANAKPVKISRGEVQLIVFRSILSYPVPSAWRSLARFSGRH